MNRYCEFPEEDAARYTRDGTRDCYERMLRGSRARSLFPWLLNSADFTSQNRRPTDSDASCRATPLARVRLSYDRCLLVSRVLFHQLAVLSGLPRVSRLKCDRAKIGIPTRG